MRKRITLGQCAVAVLGILLVGSGVAFNAMAQLGNDPVGIFYDGIRSFLRLTPEELGFASNVVNVGLAVLLVFVGRRYLNLGTLIYILPYGLCVDFGSWLYECLFPANLLWQRIAGSVAGCLLLYLGVAIYITMDIGVDPMTGTAMVLRDRLHWDYKRAKWLFDGIITVSGFLLGGTLGVVTILTALSAGPVIQFLSDRLSRLRRVPAA